MGNKRYYWFKLSEEFLNSALMVKLTGTVWGCIVLVFYEYLVINALNTEGVLSSEEYIRLDLAALANIAGKPRWMAKLAMKWLCRNGMAQWLADGSIYLPKALKYIGSETDSNVRMRRQKEKRVDAALTQVDAALTRVDAEVKKIDADIDTDKDQDTDKDKDREREPEYTGAPSQEAVYEYARELGIEGEAQAFMDFYAIRDWCVDGRPVKDWKALLRIWAKRIPDFSNGKAVADKQCYDYRI